MSCIFCLLLGHNDEKSIICDKGSIPVSFSLLRRLASSVSGLSHVLQPHAGVIHVRRVHNRKSSASGHCYTFNVQTCMPVAPKLWAMISKGLCRVQLFSLGKKDTVKSNFVEVHITILNNNKNVFVIVLCAVINF